MKIAIIGAGASGLSAAIAAARAKAEVTLFERNDRVGKKILMTGNGKCNLGNEFISLDAYRSEDLSVIGPVLERFSAAETCDFFRSLGLFVTEKRGGYYPYSEQASCVLDALRYEVQRLGCRVITETCITSVKKTDDSFCLYSQQGEAFHGFDKLIVSTGGMAAPKTGSDGIGYKIAKSFGHNISTLAPALTGLKCKGDFWKSIAGVRCYGRVIVFSDGHYECDDKGEIQLTDYGISGIPVFQVSRFAALSLVSGKNVEAVIDFVPDVGKEDLIAELKARALLLSESVNIEQLFSGLLNKKLVNMLIKKLKASMIDKVNDSIIEEFAGLVKEFKVNVFDTNSYDQAQTTAGGLKLNELTGDFESSLVKGMYFVGELLDVDGLCGGFNLHFAWASGIIAGEAAAKC